MDTGAILRGDTLGAQFSLSGSPHFHDKSPPHYELPADHSSLYDVYLDLKIEENDV